MKAVSSRFGTLDLEDSEPIPTRPALSPADDRIVLNGRKLKDSSTRMPDSALKSTRSKKSMRAAKQSRRALLPDDDRSTKTAPRGGAFANSLRHLARSLRGGNANAVRPSHSPQSHKRGWCGLRPAAVILTTLICCALIAAIVVIVVLTTGDDTPAVVYKKHGDPCTGLGPCLPLAPGELPLKCSSGVCLPAQCTSQVHCISTCHTCQAYKCTYCGEHPIFGCYC